MDFVKIAFRYLRACNINISEYYLRQRMQAHPNYPALVSFTDTLDELGLEYQAVHADKTHIPQFSFPFLAQTPKAPGGFEILPSMEYYQINQEAFLNRWEGVVLMVEMSQIPDNVQYKAFVGKEEKENVKLKAASGLALFIIILMQCLHFDTGLVAFTWLCVVGISICSLIILHKLGKDNAITEQLCSTQKNHGCDLVLNSKWAEIIKGVDFGDIGLMYFSGLLMFSLFCTNSNSVDSALQILVIPSTIAFCLTFVSLFYQWKIIKAWCKMCLITILIVWLQATVIWIHLMLFSSLQTGLIVAILPLFIFSFAIALFWLLVKPLIIIGDESGKTAIKLDKWKRDPDIFQFFLTSQPYVNTTIENNPFCIGNTDSPIHFTIVSNPFCRPCSTAHRKLEELYYKYPNKVSFSVIFLIKNAEDMEDRRTIAVQSLLKAINKGNEPEVLHEWFDTMQIESFKEKYKSIGNRDNSVVILKAYEKWIQGNEVPYTPYIFLNGFQMPKQYSISDMEDFVFELSERYSKIETKDATKKTTAHLSWQ